MLRELLEHTGIDVTRTAGLLGVSDEIFDEWLSNQRQIPTSMLTTLSNVVGIDLSPYVRRKVGTQEAASVTPAIWFRFRGDRLVSADREFVFLVRLLGFYINDLEEVTGNRAVGWKSLFQEIRQRVNLQAPPRLQGIEAANMFRESRGLSTGASGIGEVLRGNLRSMGVLVIEAPLPESQLEGCCFYVGERPTDRPCVFANSHHTTWFRRNMILLHEIAHAIFDAESSGAALDFASGLAGSDALAEERADAFAQQVLAPKQVLVHVAQRNGISWRSITAGDMAKLVAEIGAEKRTILRSAYECELVTEDEYIRYGELEISPILKELSTHALSTRDFIRLTGATSQEWVGKRTTTTTSRELRLPVSYVSAVLKACRAGEISRGRASEMLMVDAEVFSERFGNVIAHYDDAE